jgi:lactate racemase
MVCLEVPYCDQVLGVEIPDKNLVFNISPREALPAPDLAGVVRGALAHPIGTPALLELAKPGQRVLILADDYTRATPVKSILPVLLDTLNQAGIPDRDVRLLIASGGHRPMRLSEIEGKFGPAVSSRVQILTHHDKDPRQLVDYGATRHGTRVFVNRLITEADFSIAVGHIIPHPPAGWSGGAKAVLPGIAGSETIAQLHLLGASRLDLGTVETIMRQDMEEVAERVGLGFIVNAVLNRCGGLVDAVAGHYIDAHRAGVERSRQIYGVPLPGRADITISSTSPIDYDFFQGDKGIFSAQLATHPGGEIILVTGSVEGIDVLPELASFAGKLTNQQIWRSLHAGETSALFVAAEAVMLNSVMQTHRITIVTQGMPAELCRSMGFQHIEPPALAGYIRARLDRAPDLTLGLLRQSTAILPLLPRPN